LKPKAEQSRWSAASFGSRLQHEIFYIFIRLGGRRAAYLLLYPVVLYYMSFRPKIRQRTKHYLSRRFRGRSGFAAFVDSCRLSLAMGKALVDRASAGILGPESLSVKLNGREEMLELLARKSGLIVVVSHVGCWQTAMSALGFMQTPVNMLMRREDGDIDRQYYEHAGIERPYNVIEPDGFLGGALEMTAALKRGEVLCLMGDRVFGGPRSAVEVEFLGENAAFPFAAFKLASALQAPVAVLFSCKTGSAAYELTLAETISVPAGIGRDAEEFRPFVQQYVSALEKFVGEHPYQFFNFYNIWPNGAE